MQESKASDLARAIENRFWVIRADVAGANGELISQGCTEIVDSNGKVIREAGGQKTGLLIAAIVEGNLELSSGL